MIITVTITITIAYRLLDQQLREQINRLNTCTEQRDSLQALVASLTETGSELEGGLNKLALLNIALKAY
jgi:hypothetical protein